MNAVSVLREGLVIRKFECKNCGFIKIFYGNEGRKKQKQVKGFTCPRCGKKQTEEDTKKIKGKGPKPKAERRKRVKKEVVKEKHKTIVPQPHFERSEWRHKQPQPTERTFEEAVISSLNIKISAPIPPPNLEVDETETEKLDQHGENPGETVNKRKSNFERTSDRIEQYLSGLDRAQTSREISEGSGMNRSLVYTTLQLMEVFGTVEKVKRGSYHYFLKGVYDDEQISAMLPPEKVKPEPRRRRSILRSPRRSDFTVRKSLLEEHLSDMRMQASSGEGPSALAMIGLTQQETAGEIYLADELPRKLEMDLEVEESRVENPKKIEPFATVEQLPKDARELNLVQTKHLKEWLKGLDGYDSIERLTTAFAEFPALKSGSYGSVFYFSMGTNPWERVFRVTVDDSLPLEMEKPVKRSRGSNRSKYDPIIDRFIELGHDVVEIKVEGRNPNYVAFQLRKRIKDRALKIVASSKGGFVYLENKL